MNPESPTTQSAPANSAPNQPKGLAIAALVLGIVAFIFGWAGFFNLIVAILAVVFGILALVKHQSKGLALTGTILGALGLLTSLIVGIFFSAAILSGIANSSTNTTTNSQSTTNSSSSSSWDVTAAYDKITTGMSKSEVESVTGKPSENCVASDSTYGKYETCSYGSSLTDNGSISVTYVDEKVSDKTKFTN